MASLLLELVLTAMSVIPFSVTCLIVSFVLIVVMTFKIELLFLSDSSNEINNSSSAFDKSAAANISWGLLPFLILSGTSWLLLVARATILMTFLRI